MKHHAQTRANATRVSPPARKHKPLGRQALPLRSLPDCLLAAYDGVSRRAFERFVARGSKAGTEISDWRSAESDLFLPVAVELTETEEAIYALATVEELSAAEIAVAVEDRWLLISGHLQLAARFDGRTVGNGEADTARESMRWIDWDDLYSVLKDSETAPEPLDADGRENSTEPQIPVIAGSRPFCVVELPVGVDASRSVAVLADGMVAIRMPKTGVADAAAATGTA
ncbi:MAG TPA: hypothetical protein VGD60_02795 [Candidatus Acidoferrales bacterium]